MCQANVQHTLSRSTLYRWLQIPLLRDSSCSCSLLKANIAQPPTIYPDLFTLVHFDTSFHFSCISPPSLGIRLGGLPHCSSTEHVANYPTRTTTTCHRQNNPHHRELPRNEHLHQKTQARCYEAHDHHSISLLTVGQNKKGSKKKKRTIFSQKRTFWRRESPLCPNVLFCSKVFTCLVWTQEDTSKKKRP